MPPRCNRVYSGTGVQSGRVGEVEIDNKLKVRFVQNTAFNFLKKCVTVLLVHTPDPEIPGTQYQGY